MSSSNIKISKKKSRERKAALLKN